MATTASAVGSPTVNTQAAGTVAARNMRPKQATPGRFNAQRFQNPGAGGNGPRTANRSQFQNPGAGGPQMRQMQSHGQRGGGQVPGQYQTPGKPPMGGGGPQFPGDSDWWRNMPQQPPQRMWGSPQFNFMGGNAPSAQQGGGPNWGGQRGGYGQMGGYGGGGMGGQFAGGGGGGMPQGGMPSYQTGQYGNQSYGELQDRIYQQQMLNTMPDHLRNQYRFLQASGELGYNPGKDSGPTGLFQGYGTKWGQSPEGWYGGSDPGVSWTNQWGEYSTGPRDHQSGPVAPSGNSPGGPPSWPGSGGVGGGYGGPPGGHGGFGSFGGSGRPRGSSPWGW